MASDVSKMDSATSVSGDPLAIATRGGQVMIGKAHVMKTDITASNGVIHVIV
jgi:uncharacterized surface protein with fasciclin (FAS1) repeats